MNEIHVHIGDTVADSIVESIPTIRIGEPATLQLSFRENNLANVFDSPRERHRKLYDHIEWANSATIQVDRSSNGVSNYRETVPSRAPIESFVHPVQFAEDVDRIPDYWAAITGGQNTTQPGGGRLGLELETAVLARIGEYDTRGGLRQDLSASVI